jgi:hypothetical protein
MPKRLRSGRAGDPIERRYHHDEMPGPGGVNTDNSPTAVPPWQFVQLLNARWNEDSIIPRGGQSKMNVANTILSPVATIHPTEFTNASPLRAWVVGDGCPGESLGTGFYVGHYDPEQEPQVQRSVWYDLAVQGVAIAAYGGVPHVVVDLELRKISLLPVPWGIENIVLSGRSQDVPLCTLPAKCNCMLEYNGLLFMLLNDNTIYTWDGKTLRLDSTETNPPLAACLWRDELVIGFGVAANKIRIRNYAGTYTTVTPGAGTVKARAGRNTMTSHRDVVWMASGAADLWKYDGATLSIGHTIAGATIESVALAFNALYYGYTSSTPAALIGQSVNGVAFSDAHKNVTSQLAGASAVRGLVYFKDTLTAAIVFNAGTTRLIASPGEDTANANYDVQSQTGTLSNDIRYIVPM